MQEQLPQIESGTNEVPVSEIIDKATRNESYEFAKVIDTDTAQILILKEQTHNIVAMSVFSGHRHTVKRGFQTTADREAYFNDFDDSNALEILKEMQARYAEHQPAKEPTEQDIKEYANNYQHRNPRASKREVRRAVKEKFGVNISFN